MKLKLSSYFTFLSLQRLPVAPTTAAPFRQPSFLSSSRRHRPATRRENRLGGNTRSFARMVKSEEIGDEGVRGAARDATPSDSGSRVRPTNRHKPSPLAGNPVGPVLPPGDDDVAPRGPTILLRYIYEGGHIGQGRLCHLFVDSGARPSSVAVPQVMSTLVRDGVDLDAFYACAYETESSGGGWMPLERGGRWNNPFSVDGRSWKDPEKDSGLTFPVSMEDGAGGAVSSSMRIDIKLFRRPRLPARIDLTNGNDGTRTPTASDDRPAEYSRDAYGAISSSIPSGRIPIKGYFGLAILQPKTSSNVGTLLRSSYQLGASILYTVGGRYKHHSADTLNVPARIPLVELDDWNAFAASAPKSAVWVVIEMGGTPLSRFRHPRNAIYVLGSEDHGVPKSVLRGCREVVSLEAEEYGSYNVAVAGSIVMYDRMVKMRREAEVRDDGDEKMSGGDEC